MDSIKDDEKSLDLKISGPLSRPRSVSSPISPSKQHTNIAEGLNFRKKSGFLYSPATEANLPGAAGTSTSTTNSGQGPQQQQMPKKCSPPTIALNNMTLADFYSDDSGGSSTEDEDEQNEQLASAGEGRRRRRRRRSSFMTLTPSCESDFDQDWVAAVMQQFYARPLVENYRDMVRLVSAERQDNNNNDQQESNNNQTMIKIENQMENNQQQEVNNQAPASAEELLAGSPGSATAPIEIPKQCSQHILSQAFKVMVDVPDPPPFKKEAASDGCPTSAIEAETENNNNNSQVVNNNNNNLGSSGEEIEDEDLNGLDEDEIVLEEESEEVEIKKNVKDDEVVVSEDKENLNKFAVDTKNGKGRKIHHLFVKIPPKRTAKFERMVRRNRTLEHEVKVYSEFLVDLQAFVKSRVGDIVKLKIPELYYPKSNIIGKSNPEGAATPEDQQVLVIEDLTRRGFTTKDWFKHKLTHPEVLLAVEELAKFHACGLAYRMSLKEEIDEKYPYLEEDLYTSNMAKELLAKYLDSFLHFLSLLPGIQEHVLKLRKISNEVFQLLVKLRRPSDPLGTRFNTVCHGDMWMGNLMFRNSEEDGTGFPEECTIIDFHSAQFLSPATDLAHLLLTSTTREYRQKHWDEVVQSYYNTFNYTLAEFGLILRHLGTTYADFLYEVKRALRGQFLCVAFIIPIVIYCGPSEWRFERRRGSSVDRKNTVRHLIQMMAITEENNDSPDMLEEEPSFGTPPLSSLPESAGGTLEPELAGIPPEFHELYKDTELTQTLIDLVHTAADLEILDFKEFCKHIDMPRPMIQKTQQTTLKHKPVYSNR